MTNKKIEVIIIEDDIEVIHRSVTTAWEEANPFNIAIQAIINELTGHQFKPVVRAKSSDKFAQAVPNYASQSTQIPASGLMPPVQSQYTLNGGVATEIPPTDLEAKVEFHPDLVKEGVAPKHTVTKSKDGIPTINLKMSDVLKGKK